MHVMDQDDMHVTGAALTSHKWSGQEVGVARNVTYPTTVNFL